jgi:hypothetical protein
MGACLWVPETHARDAAKIRVNDARLENKCTGFPFDDIHFFLNLTVNHVQGRDHPPRPSRLGLGLLARFGAPRHDGFVCGERSTLQNHACRMAAACKLWTEMRGYEILESALPCPVERGGGIALTVELGDWGAEGRTRALE